MQISEQHGGRWILKHNGHCYLVPADLGRKIRSGQCPAELSDVLESAGVRTSRAVRLKVQLFSPILVRSISEKLLCLVSNYRLACQLIISIALLMLPFAPTTKSITPMPFLLFLFSAFWHELGHATALVYHGRRPGAIGAGVLLIFPVLWCDVTATALLSRSQRVRVDISGMIFQLSIAAIFHLLAMISQTPEFETASRLCIMAVLWNLIPFLRTDSYWLLCDLLKLNSLWKLPENATVSIRWVVYAYRSGKILFLTAVFGGLIWNVVQFLR